MKEIDTEKNTAAYMGMSTSWLRHARVLGNGPIFSKVGRSVRYCKRDVDQYLEDRKAHNTIYRRF